MGKLESQSERIEFYFPSRVSRLLRELVPLRERSRFVAQATERELKHRLFRERLEEYSKVNADTYQPPRPVRWKFPKSLKG